MKEKIERIQAALTKHEINAWIVFSHHSYDIHTKYLLEKFADFPDLNIDLITSSVNEFRIDKFADNITIHFLSIKKNNLNLHYQNNKDLLIYSFKAYAYAKKLRKLKRYDLCMLFLAYPVA